MEITAFWDMTPCSLVFNQITLSYKKRSENLLLQLRTSIQAVRFVNDYVYDH